MVNSTGMSINKLKTLSAAVTFAIAAFCAGAHTSQATEKAAPAAKPDDKAPKAAAAPVDKTAAKEVTLKGDMTCAKCGLHESKTCQNVLQVKDPGGKETKYYLTKNAASDDKHEKICKGSTAAATVTGTVGDDHGKKVMTASTVKFD
jgi:hypothetical protein